MSSTISQSDSCQIDFYLLGDSSLDAGHFASRLAMMAWERKQKVYILAATDSEISQLDELLWQHPDRRFLPHSRADTAHRCKAPVTIGTVSHLNPTDVVINLCQQAVPQPERFSRVLEIVPYSETERIASREKYRTYRNNGITPGTHEIDK